LNVGAWLRALFDSGSERVGTPEGTFIRGSLKRTICGGWCENNALQGQVEESFMEFGVSRWFSA